MALFIAGICLPVKKNRKVVNNRGGNARIDGGRKDAAVGVG